MTVTDDGRGIPTDIHAEEGISAAEVVLTRLHAGGKFNQNSYKVSGGLHGVGGRRGQRAVGVDGGAHLARGPGALHPVRARRFRGAAEDRRARPSTATGPRSRSSPARATFTQVEFDYAILERRLRELAFLNSGLEIRLRDERHAPAVEVDFCFKGGLVAFVEWLDRSKVPVFAPPISVVAADGAQGIRVEFALSWNDSFHETMLCFTNNIPQRDGGSHLAGFRQALTRVVTKYAEGMGKKDSVQLTGDDMREGMTAVLSVKVPDPKFSSQTKDKLVSSEVQPVVQAAAADAISHWFETHPREARGIIGQGDGRGHRPRGGAQGARPDAAQGRAGCLDPAGQAGRLPGARPQQVRAVHRRGRQRRRLRQAGARPQVPGDPSPQGQDPERRAGALRPHARQCRDRAR